jgi:hypothetical protein
MLPKNCGKLLYDAVRETLETMAFADVVPCSIKVAGEEFAQDDDFAVATDPPNSSEGGWGNETAPANPADAWGTAAPAVSVEASWGDSPEPTITAPADDDWSESDPAGTETGDSAWGNRSGVASMEQTHDPWGDANLTDACVAGKNRPREADFDNMVSEQAEWCWACMKVNSPDVHSVWFIVPQGLAHALMQNMYAGETTKLDTPIIRDLIAELTNVLGGRLMLLLEELGGKFTLTVPEIGFGLPDIPEMQTLQNVICKIVVDGEHPVIVALCFNQGGVLASE